MKRLLFALTACISFVFIGCNKQPTIDTHSTFEACYASEDTIPAFLEKYDSITNANLDAFINDWYVYSRAIVKDYDTQNIFHSAGGGDDDFCVSTTESARGVFLVHE